MNECLGVVIFVVYIENGFMSGAPGLSPQNYSKYITRHPMHKFQSGLFKETGSGV